MDSLNIICGQCQFKFIRVVFNHPVYKIDLFHGCLNGFTASQSVRYKNRPKLSPYSALFESRYISMHGAFKFRCIHKINFGKLVIRPASVLPWNIVMSVNQWNFLEYFEDLLTVIIFLKKS